MAHRDPEREIGDGRDLSLISLGCGPSFTPESLCASSGFLFQLAGDIFLNGFS
jgi:hypothetical protein